MATLSKITPKRIAGIVLFLVISTILTFTGFYFSWSQIHSPDWTGKVGLVLLLPYAGVNRMFHWFTGPDALPTHIYYVAFFLGTLAQMFYYFAVFTLLKRMASLLTRAPRSPS